MVTRHRLGKINQKFTMNTEEQVFMAHTFYDVIDENNIISQIYEDTTVMTHIHREPCHARAILRAALHKMNDVILNFFLFKSSKDTRKEIYTTHREKKIKRQRMENVFLMFYVINARRRTKRKSSYTPCLHVTKIMRLFSLAKRATFSLIFAHKQHDWFTVYGIRSNFA